MKKRNALIDAAKGLGILLVVLGHAVQANTVGFDNILFRLIYSFHMPLFMFLSGCVAKYGASKSITGNITRLVLPFLAWYLIAYFAQWDTTGQLPDFYLHMLTLYQNPDAGLWFLWVLFLCHVFFYVMSQAQKVGKVPAAVIIFLLVQVIPIKVLGFGLLKWHFVFFVAGYLTMRYKEYLVKWRYWFLIAAVIIYIPLFSVWQFNNTEHLVNAITSFPEIIKSHSGILSKALNYCIAFSGIVITLGLVYFLLILEPAKRFLTTIGLYTLDIYVSHQFFVKLHLGESLTIHILSTFFISLILSLVLAYFLKKIPVVKTILYGIRDQKTVVKPA